MSGSAGTFTTVSAQCSCSSSEDFYTLWKYSSTSPGKAHNWLNSVHDCQMVMKSDSPWINLQHCHVSIVCDSMCACACILTFVCDSRSSVQSQPSKTTSRYYYYYYQSSVRKVHDFTPHFQQFKFIQCHNQNHSDQIAAFRHSLKSTPQSTSGVTFFVVSYIRVERRCCLWRWTEVLPGSINDCSR